MDINNEFEKFKKSVEKWFLKITITANEKVLLPLLFAMAYNTVLPEVNLT